MRLIYTFYKTFQALSLDIVFGAAIFSMAIGKYYQIKTSWNTLICQSIAIWLIYTFDHLLDAKKIKGDASTFRHQFHKEHKKTVLIISFIVLIFGIINLYYLPPIILKTGLIGLFFVCIYFFISHKLLFWGKEICISLLYTFGIFAGPVCSLEVNLQLIQYILILQVFLLVFTNLLLFSWFDVLKDKQDGHTSIVIQLGKNITELIIKLVLIVSITLNITLLFLSVYTTTLIMQLVLLMMYSILILLFKKDILFRTNDFYRVIGDGIFFIPILFLLYNATH